MFTINRAWCFFRLNLYLTENKPVLVIKTVITARDHTTHTHTHRLSCPVSIIFVHFNQNKMLWQMLGNSKYEILWKSVQWESLCSMHTDRWTYKIKLIVASVLKFTLCSLYLTLDSIIKYTLGYNLKDVNVITILHVICIFESFILQSVFARYRKLK